MFFEIITKEMEEWRATHPNDWVALDKENEIIAQAPTLEEVMDMMGDAARDSFVITRNWYRPLSKREMEKYDKKA